MRIFKIIRLLSRNKQVTEHNVERIILLAKAMVDSKLIDNYIRVLEDITVNADKLMANKQIINNNQKVQNND